MMTPYRRAQPLRHRDTSRADRRVTGQGVSVLVPVAGLVTDQHPQRAFGVGVAGGAAHLAMRLHPRAALPPGMDLGEPRVPLPPPPDPPPPQPPGRVAVVGAT